VDGYVLEIPAGTRDVPGEPEETTAGRELAEEIGRRAGTLTLLTRYLNSAGFSDQVTTIFAATGLTVVPDDRQGTEERHMTVEEVRLAEFDSRVDDGSIVDASTIVGVGLARRRLSSAGDR
jgi:ADP-ribose pyrophosphatase